MPNLLTSIIWASLVHNEYVLCAQPCCAYLNFVKSTSVCLYEGKYQIKCYKIHLQYYITSSFFKFNDIVKLPWHIFHGCLLLYTLCCFDNWWPTNDFTLTITSWYVQVLLSVQLELNCKYIEFPVDETKSGFIFNHI